MKDVSASEDAKTDPDVTRREIEHRLHVGEVESLKREAYEAGMKEGAARERRMPMPRIAAAIESGGKAAIMFLLLIALGVIIQAGETGWFVARAMRADERARSVVGMVAPDVGR